MINNRLSVISQNIFSSAFLIQTCFVTYLNYRYLYTHINFVNNLENKFSNCNTQIMIHMQVFNHTSKLFIPNNLFADHVWTSAVDALIPKKSPEMFLLIKQDNYGTQSYMINHFSFY